MSKAAEARAFRLGTCAAAIETAKAAIKLALRTQDLLTSTNGQKLNKAYEIVNAVEQELWARKDTP